MAWKCACSHNIRSMCGIIWQGNHQIYGRIWCIYLWFWPTLFKAFADASVRGVVGSVVFCLPMYTMQAASRGKATVGDLVMVDLLNNAHADDWVQIVKCTIVIAGSLKGRSHRRGSGHGRPFK